MPWVQDQRRLLLPPAVEPKSNNRDQAWMLFWVAQIWTVKGELFVGRRLLVRCPKTRSWYRPSRHR